MSDIFFSYVEEDAALVAEIAAGLEHAGYTTWYFERDSVAGVPYVRQIPDVIDAAQAVVIVISPVALTSPHVDREVVEAYRSGKQFFPLLHNLTHSEFRERRRDWALMLGAAVSVTVPDADISASVPRIVVGLRQMHVASSGVDHATPEPAFAPPPVRHPMPEPHIAPSQVPAHPSASGTAEGPAKKTERERWPTAPVAQSPHATAPAAAVGGAGTPAAGDWQTGLERPRGTSRRRIYVAAFVPVVIVAAFAWWAFAGHGGNGETPTPTPAFSEWRLQTSGEGPTADPVGSQLAIQIPSDSEKSKEDSNSGFGAWRFSPDTLSGDFCISVVYHLKEWPRENGVRVGLTVKESGGNTNKGIERKSRSGNEKGNPSDFTEAWFFRGEPSGRDREVLGGREGERGRLLIERIDSEIVAYVSTDQSSGLTRTSLGGGWNGLTDVGLGAWSDEGNFGGESAEVVFENYKGNQGQGCNIQTVRATQTPKAAPNIVAPTAPDGQAPAFTAAPPTNTPEQQPTATQFLPPTDTPTNPANPTTRPFIPGEEQYVTPDQKAVGT